MERVSLTAPQERMLVEAAEDAEGTATVRRGQASTAKSLEVLQLGTYAGAYEAEAVSRFLISDRGRAVVEGQLARQHARQQT
jgi:hypothetical protein